MANKLRLNKQKILLSLFVGIGCFACYPSDVSASLSERMPADETQSSIKQSVSGVIKDTTGESIIGATVREQGTNNATLSDINGNFKLEVAPKAILQISYVGFQTQEIKVIGNAILDVVMKDEDEMLNEVVVTGYTTQRKADLTGAVSVVSTDALRTTYESDPMKALQGKVPGMTITGDGSPANAATIRIRGVGSINSSEDPLYIIDGVPTTRALNSLNAHDIESMQVLKDAASASIYGSRASNGVIIITTKRGKKADKVKVDFSANLTTQFYTSQSMMKLCNTEQYATAMAQAALNDGLDPVAYARNYGLNLNATTGTPITVWNPATGSYVKYTVNGYYNGYINERQTMKFSDTDWLDAISRTGFSQNYDLSLSHANDKHSTMFSLGYKKNNGLLKYSNFENISARMNSSYSINKYVTIGENLTITYSKQCDLSPMENALKMAPTVPVYEEDGVTFSGPVGGMSDRQNPLREMYDNRNNHLDYWRSFGNAYIEIKPVKGLTLKSNFGLDYYSGFINTLNYTYYSDIVNNNTSSTTLGYTNEVDYTWSNTATYNFKVANRHDFNVLIGTETTKETVIDFSAYSEGYAIENVDYMWPNAATGITSNTGEEVGYRLVSFFGKIDYNYDDLILASFTIRRDGSSRFGKDNRWGTFPAATAGIRLSKLLQKNWLDDLKLRLSWGRTGNQGIDNNAQFGLYVADYGSDRVTSTAYDLTLQGSGTLPSGYHATQRANSKLKWESAEQFNAGVDFMFLNGSLYGSLDGYVKNVRDMLICPSYLGSWGEGGYCWDNGPSLRDWGMEFVIGYRKNFACGLGIDLNGNLDFFRDRVTYLPETSTGSYAHTTTENLVQAKKPYGSIVGYVVDGLFQSQEEVDAYGQANARVGGLKYADLNKDGMITEDDQTWIFNPVPDFSYGLNIGLTYKNFDFSIFLQGVCNQDVYNNQKFQTDFWSMYDAGSNKGSRLLGAWTTANTSSTIPALTTENTSDEGRASSYFVENGSYLKLRTLQLGYNVPSSFLSHLKIATGRVYLAGQNLFTIKSKSLTCVDPENPDWNYPLSTSFSFGIQIGF